MIYEVVSVSPRLAPDNWKTAFDKELVPDEKNDWDGMIYRGTGLPIDNHPMKERLHMHGCGNCNSNDVEIIYAQWSVSVASGNEYWDYEMFCNDCKKYTSRSFSEN